MTTIKLSLICFSGAILMLIICWTSDNYYTPPQRYVNEWAIVNSPIVFWENNCPMSEAQTENVRISTAFIIQREMRIKQAIARKEKFI